MGTPGVEPRSRAEMARTLTVELHPHGASFTVSSATEQPRPQCTRNDQYILRRETTR